jgi:hypothetical protein
MPSLRLTDQSHQNLRLAYEVVLVINRAQKRTKQKPQHQVQVSLCGQQLGRMLSIVAGWSNE